MIAKEDVTIQHFCHPALDARSLDSRLRGNDAPGFKPFMLVRFCILLMCFAMLSACGFHLRGTDPLPAFMQTLYVQSNSPYDSFTRDLKTHLRYAGVRIVNSAKQAPLTLNILQKDFSTPQTSLGSSQQVREYNAIYTASYNIQDRHGKILLGPLSVSTSRAIILQANELLYNNSKLSSAEEDMSAELINQIMFQLSATNTKKALQHISTETAHETKH